MNRRGIHLCRGVKKTEREKGMETTVEAPAKLYPARAQLSGALEKYKQAGVEVSVFEARLARLELDEVEALNEVGTDEDEQCQRLVTIRSKRDVQARRVAHQREAVERALQSIEAAYKPAEMELNAL